MNGRNNAIRIVKAYQVTRTETVHVFEMVTYPMMITSHSSRLSSSTSPAEKPSTGFFLSSAKINLEVSSDRQTNSLNWIQSKRFTDNDLRAAA